MHPSRCVTIAVLTLILGACAPASVVPSDQPSAPASGIPAATLRTVAVDTVDVGNGPDEGADAIAVTPGTLVRNDPAWVLDAASQDGWLLIAGGTGLDELSTAFGWIPAELDGQATLGSAALTCPAPPLSVTQLVALGPFGGLACFGPAPITLVGFTPIGCGIGGSPRTGTPEWLNGTWSGIGIGNEEPRAPNFEVSASVSARAAPGLELDQCGSQPGWYRFAGHFDDPASETCRTDTTTPDGTRPVTIEPRLSQLLCRTQLVLTEATRLPAAP